MTNIKLQLLHKMILRFIGTFLFAATSNVYSMAGKPSESEVPAGATNHQYLNSQFAPFSIDQKNQGTGALKQSLDFKNAAKIVQSRSDNLSVYQLKINKYLFWQIGGATNFNISEINFPKGTRLKINLKKLYLRPRIREKVNGEFLPQLDIFNSYTRDQAFLESEVNKVTSSHLAANYKAEVSIELVPINNINPHFFLESRYFDLKTNDGYSINELSSMIRSLVEIE